MCLVHKTVEEIVRAHYPKCHDYGRETNRDRIRSAGQTEESSSGRLIRMVYYAR
jgi:hypothetical protein